MHIQEIHIKDIKSIAELQLTFDAPAGWHVIIGDNGAGKTSLVRAISLALIGPAEIPALREVPEEWVRKGTAQGTIGLKLKPDEQYDKHKGQSRPRKTPFDVKLIVAKSEKQGSKWLAGKDSSQGERLVWSDAEGWFSTAFGPFRRFTGGDNKWLRVYHSNPKAGAHLSVFNEDVALTEALEWLRDLKFRSLEQNAKASQVLEGIQAFINAGTLLPNGTKLHAISSEGVTFVDSNGVQIPVNQMSDGYRSVLSMIFELIRQLVRSFGEDQVFTKVSEGFIPVSGVVLIDEVDAHLHPSWQVRIGTWFTQLFPNIQFIVTTHSPLVCRAAENGTIWRLAVPGSEQQSGEVTGLDREKLLHGNILDAYGTEVFGQEPVRSHKLDKNKARLGELRMLAALGKATNDEEQERQRLQKILSTE